GGTASGGVGGRGLASRWPARRRGTISERSTVAPYISGARPPRGRRHVERRLVCYSGMPSPTGRPGRWILLAAAALAAGCHQYLDPRLYGQARHYLPDASPDDILQVRALGVHGFVARVGELAVMTPPLYSNPDLDKLA